MVGATMGVASNPQAPVAHASEPGADPPYFSPVSGMFGDRRIRVPTAAADGRALFKGMTPDASTIVVQSTQDLDPDPEIHPIFGNYGTDFYLIGDRALHYYESGIHEPGPAFVAMSDDATVIVSRAWVDPWSKTPEREQSLFFTDATGTHPGPPGDGNVVVGMTSDASVLVFTSYLKLLPADTDTQVDIYAWTRANSRLRLVTDGPDAGAFVGMATDGSHILYDLGPGLYDWTPTGTTFIGTGRLIDLSDDGRTVYFDTRESLDPTDLDGAIDGYVHGPAGYRVLTNPTPTDAGLVAVKADGTTWVFQTADALVPEDVDSLYDLYLVDAGHTTLMSHGTMPGEHLMMSDDFTSGVYTTTSSLDPDDTDQNADVYRWTAAAPDQAELLASQGNGPVLPLAYAPDGSRVLIKTAAQLIPGDTDPFADVYEWIDGDLRLVFPGDDEYSILGWSPDGRRVVAQAWEGLIPEDVNGAPDVYLSDADLVEPDVEVDSPDAPSGPTTSVTFGTDGGDGIWFECQLDGGAWDPCRSPYAVTGLTGGTHTMTVRGFRCGLERR